MPEEIIEQIDFIDENFEEDFLRSEFYVEEDFDFYSDKYVELRFE